MTFTSETLPADHKAAIRQLKRETARADRRRAGGVQQAQRADCHPRGGNQRA